MMTKVVRIIMQYLMRPMSSKRKVANSPRSGGYRSRVKNVNQRRNLRLGESAGPNQLGQRFLVRSTSSAMSDALMRKLSSLTDDGVRCQVNPNEDDEFREDSYPSSECSSSGSSESSGTSSSEDEVEVRHGTSKAQRVSDVRKRILMDPETREVMKEMVAETISSMDRGRSRHKDRRSAKHRRSSSRRSTSRRSTSRRRGKTQPEGNLRGKSVNMVKSPSDTTLYRPAMRQKKADDNNLVDRISQFIENIRIQGDRRQFRSRTRTPVPEYSCRSWERETSETESRGEVGAVPDRSVDQALQEAEQHKISLAAPKGNITQISSPQGINLATDGSMSTDNDDDFFHESCHIDVDLREKIERGEFVDLVKLLPKDRNFARGGSSDEKRFEIMTKDGSTFFTPVQNHNDRINSVRHWEQAFRVYAAIYSKANPHCTSEIWEYVYVINKAASSFAWDNFCLRNPTGNGQRHTLRGGVWP